MPNVAAGMLMCRTTNGSIEFFLVHPGGPYFTNKDAGFWSIPKGLPEGTEELLATALREFFEETGIQPEPPFHDIGMIKQKGGKVVHAWAFTGEWEPTKGIVCNNFVIEWPPRSGKKVNFPEVDKAEWFEYDKAIGMIIPEQIQFLDRAKRTFDKNVR